MLKPLFALSCLFFVLNASAAENPPKGEPTNAAEAAAKKARADAELEKRYQELVSAMPPAQQAWERVLQDNSAPFTCRFTKKKKSPAAPTLGISSSMIPSCRACF